jgi:dGTPase
MPKALYRPEDRERVVQAINKIDEKEKYRSCWRRDYARLIHSAAFRRLQGKTQLFPGGHSDFFRNRLTHSLEVAQIAKSIAIMINATYPEFKHNNIDTDLIETAALAHDLGHPPFGHNGEAALNDCMKNSGGFEGNAQTLRILAKLEKRETRSRAESGVQHPVIGGKDNRAGLNLTFRTLAAILKYDHQIPLNLDGPTPETANLVKGYYYTEASLVRQVKKMVGAVRGKPFKTLECTIMDIADDIAYSTYDVEDSFKTGFLSPLEMWTADEAVKQRVAQEIQKRLDRYYPNAAKQERTFGLDDVDVYLLAIFREIFDAVSGYPLPSGATTISAETGAGVAHLIATMSDRTVSSGYYRTRFTSDLVGEFIRSVRVRVSKETLALSYAYLDIEAFKKVEVLKNFAFQSLIMSPRLKVAEHRGKDIVKAIFRAIEEDEGYLLMPEDFQHLYSGMSDHADKKRVICDFIAGMTDRYAVQFYGRLFGTNPESIFAPL